MVSAVRVVEASQKSHTVHSPIQNRTRRTYLVFQSLAFNKVFTFGAHLAVVGWFGRGR